MNISDYLRTALLNHALAVASYSPPATVYAGLYNVLPPTSAGGGTEISQPDYARSTTLWSAAASGTIQNGATVFFPSSGLTASNWGVILGLGLFDAPTSGNLLFYGPLTASVTLAINTAFSIAPDFLTITLH